MSNEEILQAVQSNSALLSSIIEAQGSVQSGIANIRGNQDEIMKTAANAIMNIRTGLTNALQTANEQREDLINNQELIKSQLNQILSLLTEMKNEQTIVTITKKVLSASSTSSEDTSTI